MCRLAAYIGESICLKSLLLEPQYNLFTQSWQPKELTYAKLNADGFGFGWYDETGTAAIYRNCMPIWADVNLGTLARVLHSPLWLAMVRSATADYGFSPANVQPFQYKHYLFVHNGFIKDFHHRGLHKILAALKPEVCRNIRGATDSEHLFGLFCHFIEESGDNETAVKTALIKTIEWVKCNLGDTNSMLNIIISDGKTLTAARAANNETPPSLYLYHGNGEQFPENSHIIASERFSDDDDGQPVPSDTLITAEPGQTAMTESL